ncbi:prepilin-type N-terminal cleavage/methylation domain-containing protein [Cytobacillus eiseniae]|uniref:Prepilin-type N-terminal cleavage/methylation domain-containing protein n=1 Tax=Cytobacillus eiseniae TaxID=762947 RepID=A0ABS4RE61_9BACI|nr:prepilin-type N-terminal cleavage/methylation domain-containing protein [Cytobacillus eiseniae]MBP2240599.1 prepilin-type N-terminal cleavage/methylation domain-containing protein [Cytobacillus eiseniae]
MNYKKIFANSRGFTLIEILLSLTILGIIIIGSMQFFSQAYTYTNMNQKKTAAVNVARNALMYIEKENFIIVRDVFEKNPDEELTIKICEQKYKSFWKDKPIDSSCEDITINNVKYNVSIRADKILDPHDSTYSFYVPLKVNVHWTINRKEHTTELDGAIKSEDIR